MVIEYEATDCKGCWLYYDDGNTIMEALAKIPSPDKYRFCIYPQFRIRKN